jgi:Family of unknown function (DUF6134)
MRPILLALTLLLSAALSSGIGAHAQPRTLEFDVLREGAPIGTHRVTIDQRDGETRVEIAIDMAVRFAFLTVYRYTHRSQESWREGRLVALDAQTDDNGARTQVDARATADGLNVRGSGGTYVASPETVPTSYWNRDKVARGRLLDTQSGKLIDVAAQGLTNDASGATWRLSGDLEADLAYGPAGDWTSLAFVTRGSRIVYVRRDNASAVPR